MKNALYKNRLCEMWALPLKRFSYKNTNVYCRRKSFSHVTSRHFPSYSRYVSSLFIKLPDYKMKSDNESGEQNETGEQKEKLAKKLVVSPKLKSKRPSFLIKKLRLKSKSIPCREEIKDIANLPLPSTSSDERQTPEGDDNFILTKSASETNLQESWKSAENLAKDNAKSPSESAVTVECNQFDSTSEQKGLPERTKSLENLNDMPAYGELILDQAPATVIYLHLLDFVTAQRFSLLNT
ncbi:hypothetical protein JTB14_025735 [Gonioctena quinquepunctata]|nr:hypothetical protein JTB14_025735 [Gonioctena quinquepunctata]